MPRTDTNGRELQAVLSYDLNRAVPATELHRALGIARNTYAHRSQEDDFPNAEECRLIALYFELNPVDLQLTFGLIRPEHLEGSYDSVLGLVTEGKVRTAIPRSQTERRTTQAVRLKDLRRRVGAPSL